MVGAGQPGECHPASLALQVLLQGQAQVSSPLQTLQFSGVMTVAKDSGASLAQHDTIGSLRFILLSISAMRGEAAVQM